MAKIICVHGIAQEQKSWDTLEEQWVKDLAGGVRTAGFADLADNIRLERFQGGLDIRMAYYGDLFLVPGQQGLEPAEFTNAESELARLLGQEWLERAANRAPVPEDRKTAGQELRVLQEDAGEEQGIRTFARTPLNALARLKWFAPFGMQVAEVFINRALKQVTQYFTDNATREEVTKRVLDLLGPDTEILIGHSLGSVVAFEVAHRLTRPLSLLLTLGSPLGLETIIYQRILPQPPTYPLQVQRWVNVYDSDDLIAVETDLASKFLKHKPDQARLENIAIQNDAKPHDASRYLSKKEVGQLIAEALN